MANFTQKMKFGIMAAVFALGLAIPQLSSAAEKQANVWCAKTNTGNYFPLVRISMMVVPDGGNTFEILLKDGEGEANVKSVSFEQHKVSIDFDKYKYQSDSGDQTIDTSKKCFMFTNTGRFFSLGADKPKLDVIDGSNLFNVTDRNGNILTTDVEVVKFMRTNEPSDLKSISVEEEKLTLLTPIGHQMQISGCGDAKVAVVYAMSGSMVAKADVESGVTTLQVSDLTPGIYVVKVGHKTLQFIKK